ncbi:MAG: dihydropteroate synthase [Oligoflexales bacterium]|nr:dihydropteroate synthase [Oligoflexales bacterium]
MSPERRNFSIIGIVNVTPDSFSDGGIWMDPGKAVEKAFKLAEDGADIVEFGAESTRPGASFISEDEEWRRLEPVLFRLMSSPCRFKIGIDSNKPSIMTRSLEFGIHVVNDVLGGADEDTLRRLSKDGISYIAMHMHRTPDVMQVDPLNVPDAVGEVDLFYREKSVYLASCGFPEDRIWLDPGIGFGKTDAANLNLIKHAYDNSSNYNIVVGVSRKGFIGRILDINDPASRDGPSKALEAGLMFAGVRAVRTHDVRGLNRFRELFFI